MCPMHKINCNSIIDKEIYKTIDLYIEIHEKLVEITTYEETNNDKERFK